MLVELLTVMTIIALLATIVFAALQDSRAKGRDTQRIQNLKELQKGIEMYFSEYGYFPPLAVPTSDARSRGTGFTCSDGTIGDQNWCALVSAIAPYHRGGVDDPISTAPYSYYYDADGTQPQYYGLMVMLESPGSDDTAISDNGYYCTVLPCASNTRGYEIGNEPIYCMQNGWGDWRTGAAGRMCALSPFSVP
jgi:type II secretory pathway pseudopilin PulG